ncbi:PHD finger ING1-like [Chlorella sorokiniana]|uniref:PHD finger protein ING n=1 Tax=Chlorella sorokiniana TaxID=3076 RepID=A0A2P6TYM3_CHLSO|nr:PHD finger ING1-like [Chlorella sorokiniana]|eukprot:PRW59158.1 PHD finger ING1-like [Chlorella sorokiniana]
MRELDERAYRLQQQVDADMLQQLKLAGQQQQQAVSSPTKRQKAVNAAAAAAKEAELAERLEANMNELVKLSDEKLNIATQIYDYIDRHITKLDKDCKAFDAEIAKERQRLGLPPVEPTVGGGSVDTGGGGGKRKRKDGGGEQRKLTPEEQYQQALAMADPSEPKYCHCQRISFGEMIACENPDCPYEWFHFGCVGLTEENRPKGKWYCQLCRKQLKLK